MLRYYFDLALKSLRRSKALTALMVLAIALGVGASMTTLTVLRVLSQDPLPGKSSTLYYPQIDPRPQDGFPPGDEPPSQLTRLDAEALLEHARADRQALMTGGAVAVSPEREGVPPFYAPARYTTVDFFAMFEVPFLEGRAWGPSDDEDGARVAVIAKDLSQRLFGSTDAVGRTVRLEDHVFRVVGVIDHWRPAPRFYDLTHSHYAEAEEIFVPFSTSRELDLSRSGSMDCFDVREDNQRETDVGAPCVWVQFWVELGGAREARDYLAFLEQYSAEQRESGRFARPANVRLPNLNEWLVHNEVVPRDVQLQTWLALAFLAVCLINTIGLLLAKFLRRAREIAVRRALGATRRSIFAQYLVESGLVGLAGGGLGLGLTLLGLFAVRRQPTDYAELAQLDPLMLLATFVLSLAASLLAGALPAWRACQVSPAPQLKSN